jgi:hypothetical protein
VKRDRLGLCSVAFGLLLPAGGCSSSSEDAATPKQTLDAGADADAAEADAGPGKLGEHAFGSFEDWASPIADYISVGGDYFPNGFNQAITELHPLGDRLWLGYGDGTLNLGEETPIEIRFFASPIDPAAAAAAIDGAGQGAPQTTPYQSGEEQIDRFRLLDGALWQAGVDSIEPRRARHASQNQPEGHPGQRVRSRG